MNILIYQDEYSKRICKVDILNKEALLVKLQNAKSYLVDCDEDAYIIQQDFPPDPELGRIIEIPSELPLDFFFPIIAQDQEGTILMAAYGNQSSLSLSFQTGFAYYFSRSRNRVWKKGEESGHVQKIITIEYSRLYRYFVFRIKQNIAACHTGYYSCFYRRIKSNIIENVYKEKLFEPEKIYAK